MEPVKVTLYTNKNWGAEVECVHGVINDAALEAFHYGYCHVMALELHKFSGWPLIGIWYNGDNQNDDHVPGHVAVRHPNGYIVDIYGAYEEDPGDFEITDTAEMYEEDVYALCDNGYKDIDPEAKALAESLVEAILDEVDQFLYAVPYGTDA